MPSDSFDTCSLRAEMLCSSNNLGIFLATSKMVLSWTQEPRRLPCDAMACPASQPVHLPLAQLSLHHNALGHTSKTFTHPQQFSKLMQLKLRPFSGGTSPHQEVHVFPDCHHQFSRDDATNTLSAPPSASVQGTALCSLERPPSKNVVKNLKPFIPNQYAACHSY